MWQAKPKELNDFSDTKYCCEKKLHYQIICITLIFRAIKIIILQVMIMVTMISISVTSEADERFEFFIYTVDIEYCTGLYHYIYRKTKLGIVWVFLDTLFTRISTAVNLLVHFHMIRQHVSWKDYKFPSSLISINATFSRLNIII